jgi:glycine/D-amino acid oxidase-like deaminating enzyme
MTISVRLVNQNWWFTTLMVNAHKYCPPLTKAIKCDVLIVGGGFSGVSAASEFLRKGLSVVLIEKNIIGGSSSGRSAGFLTPDSELELHQLVRRYGTKAAAIWKRLYRVSTASSTPSTSTISSADCCGRILFRLAGGREAVASEPSAARVSFPISKPRHK